MERPVVVGALALDPNGVTIWRTVREYFIANGMPMDYALFSSYEALDQALLGGAVDIAWNAPMAQAQALIQSGGACRALAMRDTDRGVTTAIIVRAGSAIQGLEDLRARRLAMGEPGSSELAVIPAYQLRREGFDVRKECEVVYLEPTPYPGGRHVDVMTIVAALEDGEVDAATVFEPYFDLLAERGRLDRSAFRVVWRGRPFSHCGFAARPGLSEETASRFVRLLTAMDYGNRDIKEMMDLEHLRAWVPADGSGWDDLVAGVREADLVGAVY
jgi:ABC-type phosphate/phosphonate transport system substrate-binding protein